MPQTSDVVVDTTKKIRGRIALMGVLVPGLMFMLFWWLWKVTGRPELLFIGDAFLIYPMVQCFPLDPLEGIHLWRWRKLVWILTFGWIMFMFLLAASEAVKGVI